MAKFSLMVGKLNFIQRLFVAYHLLNVMHAATTVSTRILKLRGFFLCGTLHAPR